MTPQEAWEKRYAPRKWADAAQGLQNIWLGAWTIASAMHIEAERERCAKLCDEWARDLMRQCKAAGVPFLMKQLGAQPRGWCAAQVHADEEDREDGACDFYEGHELRDPCPGRCVAMRAKKGDDPAEWPEDLRVREYPHP